MTGPTTSYRYVMATTIRVVLVTKLRRHHILSHSEDIALSFPWKRYDVLISIAYNCVITMHDTPRRSPDISSTLFSFPWHSSVVPRHSMTFQWQSFDVLIPITWLRRSPDITTLFPWQIYDVVVPTTWLRRSLDITTPFPWQIYDVVVPIAWLRRSLDITTSLSRYPTSWQQHIAGFSRRTSSTS